MTDIKEAFIEHKNDDHYIINTHALHNATLTRKLLPRHLTAPIPYFDPAMRQAEHQKMAASLQTAQDERRTKEAAAQKERRSKAANTLYSDSSASAQPHLQESAV